MDEFDEIVREFLVESYENLDQLDRDLVALEQEPDAHPLLQSIFRTIHTIKGTSGFLAFGKLEVLTHAGEGLLARLRDGGLRLTQERATGLLELVDAVRGILAAIEATGVEDDRDYTDLVARLTALQTPLPEAELATAGAAVADGASAATRGRPTKATAQAASSSTRLRVHRLRVHRLRVHRLRVHRHRARPDRRRQVPMPRRLRSRRPGRDAARRMPSRSVSRPPSSPPSSPPSRLPNTTSKRRVPPARRTEPPPLHRRTHPRTSRC